MPASGRRGIKRLSTCADQKHQQNSPRRPLAHPGEAAPERGYLPSQALADFITGHRLRGGLARRPAVRSRYDNFGLRKTHSAAILPSRTTTTSSTVYSGGAPFAPEPQARIPPSCRACGSPCGVFFRRICPTQRARRRCRPAPAHGARSHRCRSLRWRYAVELHRPPLRPPEGFDEEVREFAPA